MSLEALNKRQLLGFVVERLESELRQASASQHQALEAATHEEARPENDKDTRALETSYLARGQAKRVAELERELELIRALPVKDFTPEQPIAAGALVNVEVTEGGVELYLLLLAGGGVRLTLADGATVAVVSVRSPVGRALLGSRVGDVVEVRVPHGVRECTVLGVC